VGPIDLAAVMDDLAAALETIPQLRVFPYWADRVTPPAAVVAWPDPLTYDSTMQRGSDQAELSVLVMVGKVDARSSRDQLARYADGSGTHSVKAAIDGYAATAYDVARVSRAEFGVFPVAGVEYLAATFFVDIFGPGSGS
jgi:hypothetical protein